MGWWNREIGPAERRIQGTIQRGETCLDARDNEGALECANQVLAEDAGHVRGLHLKAVALSLLGREREAIAVNEIRRSMNPNDPAVLLDMAADYIKLRQPGDAEPLLRSVLEGSPGSVRATMSLGDCLSLLGRDQEAQEYYLRAIESEPENPAAYCSLGFHHLRCGRRVAAVPALKKALELGMDEPEIRQTVAKLEHWIAVTRSSSEESP